MYIANHYVVHPKQIQFYMSIISQTGKKILVQS